MLQLVYVSAASAPFTSEALQVLLTKARLRNSVYSVTGLLLYHSGSFLQILEGAETGVELIYASIQRDARHTNPKILHRETISQREFGDWSMGFMDTSLWQLPPGMIEYHRVPQVATAPTAAERYLRFFHQGLCRQALPV
jgi:Sensors of blue-light using FAD